MAIERLNGVILTEEEAVKVVTMRSHLEAMVPLAIHDLIKMGGITDWHLKRVSGYAWDIGSGGDALLYRVKGESAKMMGKLTEALAVMAFLPGGVTFLGLHFEVPQTEEKEQT